MSFARLIDVTVENTLAMLGLVYTYIEIVCCVWRPFYDVHTSLGLSVCRESLLDRHCEYWDERTCTVFLYTWTDVLCDPP
jgi:hypothetical protein